MDTPAARIAVISLHTSPFDQPGSGTSGGMNVEIRAVSEWLGARDVAVDIFTRCAGRSVPEIQQAGPMTRVIQVQAGPCAELGWGELPGILPDFADRLLPRMDELGPYDLVHAHYWLSMPSGIAAARELDVPLVSSFHTLAKVKNLALAEGDTPEPLGRVAGELRGVAGADRLVAPTEDHARDLVDLYEADPSRVRVVAPGVDALRFFPRDPREARRRLGLGAGPVALFVGRLQPLKGPDLALRAFGEAIRLTPGAMRDATLLVVGGPSGPASEGVGAWLAGLAEEERIAERVLFRPPVPHDDLAWLYSAADVLLMPSSSESFGLAALEAQACGTPVVAAQVGGLRHAVRDGCGGFTVQGRSPGDYADMILRILSSPDLSRRLSRRGITHARTFPWERAVEGLLGVYGELVPALESAQAS